MGEAFSECEMGDNNDVEDDSSEGDKNDNH
jgi:hypothetical protein